jgi:hypothetical protein
MNYDWVCPDTFHSPKNVLGYSFPALDVTEILS